MFCGEVVLGEVIECGHRCGPVESAVGSVMIVEVGEPSVAARPLMTDGTTLEAFVGEGYIRHTPAMATT